MGPSGKPSPYGRYDDTNYDGHFSLHAGSQDYAGSFVKNSKGKKTFKPHGSYNAKTGGKKFHGSGQYRDANHDGKNSFHSSGNVYAKGHSFANDGKQCI
jgi:hypothetical protein